MASTYRFLSATALNNLPAGPQGPTGPQGPQGPAGAAGATGPQGPAGPAGAAGAAGPQGPAGVDGKSVSIKGTVANAAALSTVTAPLIGDGWIAGDTGHLHVYAGSSTWTDVGAVRGPAGPAGAIGPQGPAGPTGATGPQGPAGAAGATGAAGHSPVLAWTGDQITIDGVAGPHLTGPAGPAGTGGGSGGLTRIWANDDGSWPTASINAVVAAGLSQSNQLELIVPPSALPEALAFPAPPVTAQRYVTYYGPPTVPRLPLVTASATTTNTGRKVTFTAVPDLAAGAVAGYAWEFFDSADTKVGQANTSTATATYVYPTVGSAVKAKVVLSDSYNLTATATTATVAITEGVPTAGLTVSANGMDLTWTITGTDPEGSSLSWALTGSDGLSQTGTVASGASVTYVQTVTTAGTKSGSLTVTDDKGSVSTAATASVTIVQADTNGWITSDDYTGDVATAAALLTRQTTATRGGYAQVPAATNGQIRTSGGYLEWLASNTASGSVTYNIGAVRGRIAFPITATTSGTSIGASFAGTNGSVFAEFKGDGSIGWGCSVTSPTGYTSGSIKAAGTWVNGDEFDIDFNAATKVMTIKHTRAASLLGTYTTTITNSPIPTCATVKIWNGSSAQPGKVDWSQIGYIP